MQTTGKRIGITGKTIVFALLAAGLLALLAQPAQATHLDKPGNVTVTPAPDAFLVSWDRVSGENNWPGTRTRYHLRYRVKSPQGEWNGYSDYHFRIADELQDCNASRCSFNLSNAYIRRVYEYYRRGPYLSLVPGTAYDVQVSARGNDASFGFAHDHESAPVSAVFGAPGTPGAPATETSTAGLVVTWTEPGDNGSEITGYSVQWKKSDEAEWDPHQDSGLISTLNATIANLEVDTLYDVRVRAQNSRGWSNWSAVVSGEGADPIPSVYFEKDSDAALEIASHGLRYTELYTVEIYPPLEYDSSVHLRIKPNPYPDESDPTEGEDYTLVLPDAPGMTATKVLDLPAGSNEASFRIWFEPDLKTEGVESMLLELAAIEDASYTVVDGDLSDKYPELEIAILDNSRSIPPDADKERGIDIQPKSAIVGATDTVSYTVALTSMPASDVTVKAYLEGPDGEPINIGYEGYALRVSPSSLTFPSMSWSTPQTFTVSLQGSDPAGRYFILHGLESEDADYDTNYWFQGPGIDGTTQIKIFVKVGGL